MAQFPDQDLELTAAFAFGADLTAAPSTWAFTDLSDRIVDTPITISRGVLVGAGTTKSGSVTGLTLLNDDGALTPFLPTSPWHPYVDVGTPVRLSLRTNTTPYVTDTFDRTVASGWGTAETYKGTGSGNWLNTSGLSVSGGKGLLSIGSTNTTAQNRLFLRHRDVDVTFDASIPVVSSGAPNTVGLRLRQNTSGQTFLWPQLEFDTGGSINLSVWAAVGGSAAQLAFASVAGLTYTAGTAVRCRVEAIGDRVRMKAWLPGNTEPATWALEMRTTVVTATDSYLGLSAWVLSGNTNTLPTVFSFDNLVVQQPKYARAEMYIADVQPSFRPVGDGTFHSVVQVRLGGIGTRLERRQAAELSPLRRSIEKDNPVPIAYWPLEDKAGATQAASAFAGQDPMTVTGPAVFSFDLGDTEDNLISKYGSAALCSVAAGAKLTASVPQATSTSWTVGLAQQSFAPGATIGGGTADIRLLEWFTPSGTFQRWALISAMSGGYVVRAYDTSAFIYVDIATYGAGTFGGFAHHSVTATQTGADIHVEYVVNGNVLASGTITATNGPVTRVSVNPDMTNVTGSTNALGIRFVVGHVAVYDAAVLALPFYNDGVLGVTPRGDRAWAFEAAHRRALRLAAEERVPLRVIGAPYTTGVTKLNAQQPGAFQQLLTTAGESGSGTIIAEGEFGYLYRERTDRYNQPVDLTIDMSAYARSGGIDPAEVLVPKLDARGPNIWTVERNNGSSATVAADSTYLERRGEVRDQAVLDVLYDSDTVQHASWRTHLSVDGQGANYPNATLDLLANPGLIDDFLLCDIGSRMQRTNQPTIAGLGVIDQVIDGLTETFSGTNSSGGRSWTATLDTSPAAVWQVGTWDGGYRYDSASTTLATALTSTDTHAKLATADTGDVWSSADVPYAVTCLGQESTVRWMSAPGSVCAIDGGFETGVSGWSTVSATLTASTLYAHRGTGSALLTVTGSPTAGYMYNTVLWPVSAGVSYTASAWYYTPVGVASARVVASFYTGTPTFISAVTGTPTSIPAGVWTQLTVTGVAPAGAVQAYLLVQLTGSPVAGTQVWIDDVDLALASPVAPVIQHATLTRGTNGVSRSLPAGEQVHIANPAYWGL